MNQFSCRFVAFSSLFIVAGSCGKKSSSNDTTSDTGATGTGFVANVLANAYPTGLSLSLLPTTTTSSSLALDDETAVSAQKPIAEARKEQEKILEGTGNSCIPPILHAKPKPELSSETCYGFDYDMIVNTRTMSDGRVNKSGTDNGKDIAGTQACLVSFAQSKVSDASDQVDRATAMVQAMMCQARKNTPDIKLPEVGVTLDLKEALTAALDKKAAKAVTTATIKRLSDNAGRPVYYSVVTITDGEGKVRTTNLVHSPKSTDEAAGEADFSGTLWTIMDNSSKDPNPTMKRLMSVNYARTVESGVPHMRYELRAAKFHPSLVSTAFSSAGVLDFNVGVDSDNNYVVDGAVVSEPNGAVDGATYVAFDLNPTDNSGNFSYWRNPGGNYTEPARGMLFNVTKNSTTGVLEGCAVTGAAVVDVASDSRNPVSIRKAIKEDKVTDWLVPTAFYHSLLGLDSGNGQETVTVTTPTTADAYYTRSDSRQGVRKWLAPAVATGDYVSFGYDQRGPIITKQCFKQTTAGVYEIDTSKTTGASGYDLVKTADTSKLLTAPNVKDKIRKGPKVK